MDFCKLREQWQNMTPEERELALTEYIHDLMTERGLDPSDYTVTFEPVPTNPNADGGFDWASDTIYIKPDLLADDEPFSDTIAATTAAHEVRHAMQKEIYEDYGAGDGTTNPLDVGFREEDAEAFADSVVPDGLEDCNSEDLESSVGDKKDMPLPASPAGDFTLPSGDTAYA
jgi:hypothetical protein